MSHRNRMKFFGLFGLLLLAAQAVAFGAVGPTPAAAQQPTGTVPTVTGTPTGPFVTVTYPDPINVRAGPSSYFYPAVGVLLPNQVVPAIGRSPGGEWIQIEYVGIPGGVGWVYSPLVLLSPGARLKIVEPPPTPTPLATRTLDPTLAAAFIVPATPTRLPTFTPPGPLSVPTFVAPTPDTAASGVPMGFIIISLAVVGAFGALISFLRGR